MRFVWLLGCASLVACTGSNLVRTAEQDSAEDFRRKLPGLVAEWEVDEAEARAVARLVAAREVAGAAGASGVRALEAVTACAAELDDALAERSRKGDDAAAQAALLRFEADLATPDDVGPYLTGQEPWWRALAARTLTVAGPAPDAQEDGCEESTRRAAAWRRRLLADPAATVRAAALKAAWVARDPTDVDELLRAARLDPDRALRSRAIAALGQMTASGVARALWDVWVDADELDRAEIVRAWQRLADRDPEASSALVRATDGAPSLATAAACLALIGPHVPSDESQAAATAAQVLARAIESASPRVRAVAIEGAPLAWPELRKAVQAAVDEPEPEVAAAAAARVLDDATADAKRKSTAASRLRVLAKGVGPGAERARAALVDQRDPAAAAAVDREARAASAVDRAHAARSWVRLGETRRAVLMLADTDPAVRAAAACALLRGADADG